MVNKYCSPQQEGPHGFTSGRGAHVWVYVYVRVCVCVCMHVRVMPQRVFKRGYTKLPCSQFVYTALPFLIYSAREAREKKTEMTRLRELLCSRGVECAVICHPALFDLHSGERTVQRDLGDGGTDE